MIPDMLSPAASRFVEALSHADRTIVRLDALWGMLQRAAPEVLTSSSKRQRLAEIIDELAAAGYCERPTSRSSWDTTGRPHLPRFLRVPRPPAAPRLNVLAHPWLPEISAWVAGARLTRSQLENLAAINAWLARRGPNGKRLPLRERSYEIFADEKRLDQLLGGALFRDGRLTLDRLGAEVVHPPLVTERIGVATGLLIVENHTTYWSMIRAAEQHIASGVPSRFGWVAFGGGRLLEGTIASARALDPAPTEIAYFGDLDADGLSIPLNAARLATGVELPPVVPHVELYEMLVDLGTPAPAQSKTPVPAGAAGWLGPHLASRVSGVLAGTERIAQEAVNRLALEAADGWLDWGSRP